MIPKAAIIPARNNVRLYRKMALLYTGVKASTPEQAARNAARRTSRPVRIEECYSRNSSALVDLAGDIQYRPKMIDLTTSDTDLKQAARRVIDNWSSGDLTSALCDLEAALEAMEGQP